MQNAVSAGIIGIVPERDGGPPKADATWRLSKVGDFERLFGADWDRSAALVAAAVALMNGVPRVVVAHTLAALPEDTAPIAVLTPTPLSELGGGGLIVVDYSPEMTPDAIAQARARNVRVVHAGGLVLLPGRRGLTAVSGAALALPLLFGTPMLGPLVELVARPASDGIEGVLGLVQRTPARSGPRVALPYDEAPLKRARQETPPSGPTAGIEAALRELARQYTHRLGRTASDLATLRRDAERVLQGAKAAGTITGYGLAVEPQGDDLAIEVAVTLPKRIGKVIIKLSAL